MNGIEQIQQNSCKYGVHELHTDYRVQKYFVGRYQTVRKYKRLIF